VRLAVTDAHALIWATTGRLRRLGRQARAFFDRVETGEAVLYVPTHVLLEMGEAHAAGDFAFSGGNTFDAWLERLTHSGRYVPVELSIEIVRRAQNFYDIPERGDRIVAASASVLGCAVITRDPAIGRVAGVETIW
jgi:predicted nucleic acid-binding protein